MATAADSRLVLEYQLNETAGTRVIDSSGKGNDGTLVNGAAPSGPAGVKLDGVNDYVQLPNNILSGLSAVTVSTEVLIDADQQNPYFIYGLGNSTNGAGNGYLFTTGNNYRTSIATGNWSTEQTATSTQALPRGAWKTLTYTLSGGTAVLYLDGVEVNRKTGVTITPGSIGGGTTTANWIGRSLYSVDKYLKGSVRNFRIFNAALTQQEVTALSPTDQSRATDAANSVTVVNANDVRGNLTLPLTAQGLPVTWTSSNPSVVSTTGVVTRPATGTNVTLTAKVTSGSAQATKTIVAQVRAAAVLAPFAGYAFSYFTGSSIAGENIYFAASNGNNALDWTELNAGQPVLTSNQGTKGLRDPFLVRSPEGDKFYLIATDLSIGSGTTWDASQRTGSKFLEVWESTDLVTWSAQRHVKLAPDTAGNLWAPEAVYDPSLGAYVVFWASKLYAESDVNHTGNTYNKMMYATTRDFVTFSTPQIWVDPGQSVIDSTVVKEGNFFYRFTKDEGSASGCTDIIQERSSNLLAVDLPNTSPKNWTLMDSCIGRDAGTKAVEGPTAFKSNIENKWYLFVDEFGGRGYIPLESTSLENPNWKVPASYKLPASPRHGTVIPVTQAELTALKNEPAPKPANANGEILRYSFNQTTGTTVTDSSGNGLNATAVGGTTWQTGGSLKLNGTDGHVDLPDNLLAGMVDVTVEADVFVDAAQSGSYFLYGMGNTNSSGVGNGYLFATGNSTYKNAIATGNWATEQSVAGTAALPRGTWQHLVYTLKGDVATIYSNGVQVSQASGVTIDPRDIGGGLTKANYIGRSVYSADKYFSGQIREFAIYNRALTSAEAITLSSK